MSIFRFTVRAYLDDLDALETEERPYLFDSQALKSRFCGDHLFTVSKPTLNTSLETYI